MIVDLRDWEWRPCWLSSPSLISSMGWFASDIRKSTMPRLVLCSTSTTNPKQSNIIQNNPKQTVKKKKKLKSHAIQLNNDDGWIYLLAAFLVQFLILRNHADDGVNLQWNQNGSGSLQPESITKTTNSRTFMRTRRKSPAKTAAVMKLRKSWREKKGETNKVVAVSMKIATLPLLPNYWRADKRRRRNPPPSCRSPCKPKEEEKPGVSARSESKWIPAIKLNYSVKQRASVSCNSYVGSILPPGKAVISEN